MKYYFLRNGQPEGPYEREELLKNGVKLNTLVWYHGLSQWTPAGSLPDLQDLFACEDMPPVPVNENKTVANNNASFHQASRVASRVEPRFNASFNCPPAPSVKGTKIESDFKSPRNILLSLTLSFLSFGLDVFLLLKMMLDIDRHYWYDDLFMVSALLSVLAVAAVCLYVFTGSKRRSKPLMILSDSSLLANLIVLCVTGINLYNLF